MNTFDNLVPPNMDTFCTSTSTVSGGVTSIQQTCSDPWNYYKGYGFDIITILLGIWIVVETIIKAVDNYARK